MVSGLFLWLKNIIYSRMHHALTTNEQIPEEDVTSKVKTSMADKEEEKVITENEKQAQKDIETWQSFFIFGEEEKHLSFDRIDLIQEHLGNYKCLLTKADINEIKGFSKPPTEVEQVLQALMAAFEVEPEAGEKECSWRIIKRFLINQNFLKELKSYYKYDIDFKTMKKIHSYIKDLDLKTVMNASKGAVGLYDWLKNVVNSRVHIALFDNEPVPKTKRKTKKRSPAFRVNSRPQTTVKTIEKTIVTNGGKTVETTVTKTTHKAVGRTFKINREETKTEAAPIKEKKPDPVTWEEIFIGGPEQQELNTENAGAIASSLGSFDFDVSKNDLIELKSFSSPPNAVVNVLSGVLAAFKIKPDTKGKDYSWTTIKKFIARPDFLKKLSEFDASTLSFKNC